MPKYGLLQAMFPPILEDDVGVLTDWINTQPVARLNGKITAEISSMILHDLGSEAVGHFTHRHVSAAMKFCQYTFRTGMFGKGHFKQENPHEEPSNAH